MHREATVEILHTGSHYQKPDMDKLKVRTKARCL